MTPEERAREACGCARCQGHKYPQGGTCAIAPRIAQSIREAVEAEREACAKVADDHECPRYTCVCSDPVAAQIRARQQGEG